ncbi:MAG: DUF561 domain-containing protein [Cyanobacteria bacterium NC_groundwater_1444_Ag_S-0.65um_54_12]|nr:DUF561 domain-containing protein [Cyanobacteria bacterium NC_groundwater_1444_Ag_S-0.65um_54_12]
MLKRLSQAIMTRTFFKAISGIDVFEPERVLPLVRAATKGAHAVDVAADAELVAAARAAAPALVIFASATNPEQLVSSGADVLELGNYDAMYRAGQDPTAQEVLDWTRAIVAVTKGRIPLCVTVPGKLPLTEQLDLARTLQAAGADILQTEGIIGSPGAEVKVSVIRLAEALANTKAIREVIDLPIILAGGIDAYSAPYAIAAGANGVGVGHFIKTQCDETGMAEAVVQVANALTSARVRGSALYH